jgi:hypothetical protein
MAGLGLVGDLDCVASTPGACLSIEHVTSDDGTEVEIFPGQG